MTQMERDRSELQETADEIKQMLMLLLKVELHESIDEGSYESSIL